MSDRFEDVRETIRDALAGHSTDSAAVETPLGDLAIVFFDANEAYSVSITRVGLMVLPDEEANAEPSA